MTIVVHAKNVKVIPALTYHVRSARNAMTIMVAKVLRIVASATTTAAHANNVKTMPALSLLAAYANSATTMDARRLQIAALRIASVVDVRNVRTNSVFQFHA